ncbi:MAG: TIGR02757 family protein [Bacteroidia bacterium]|nr:TIGR02757 family protein [Bacteroidia bacterium]
MTTNNKQLKEFLDLKTEQFNSASFIEHDPVSIPHRFSKKEDIEIAAFLASIIAWGQRKTIITNGNKLMQLMDEAPHDFIVNFTAKDLKPFEKFVHRTFNGTDCAFFMKSLKNIYKNPGGLENAFCSDQHFKGENVGEAIIAFRKNFFAVKHPGRTKKHISDPSKNSSAKRLCMYLRWMVRKDNCGVDFGLWKKIKPAQLCLPLDVHTGNVSRQLKLLLRKQNDWQAVEEITNALKKFDPVDPVKYDFALCGIGVSGGL